MASDAPCWLSLSIYLTLLVPPLQSFFLSLFRATEICLYINLNLFSVTSFLVLKLCILFTFMVTLAILTFVLGQVYG